MDEIFIGIDGGGTHTRAIAVTRTGKVVARTVTGGSNPEHLPESDAQQNAHEAIRQVVKIADCEFSDVAGLVGGLAGVNQETENVERYLTPDGLSCPRVLVNDSVVAHAGAFLSRSGIVAIGGTGSIVFGVNEAGDSVRNFDFRHWAAVNAGYIAYHAAHRLIAGDGTPADQVFAAQVFAHWQVDDLGAFQSLGVEGFLNGNTERNYHFGSMAKLMTDAAQSGSPLAQSICDQGAAALCVGIRLVATRFRLHKIEVVLIGGVARSDYMQKAVDRVLSADSQRTYSIVDPAFSPEIGAVMMALKNQSIEIDDSVLVNLAQEV